jgi:putative endonuclease
MFYYVYVLQSKKDKRWYTGFTNDIRKRLTQHNMNQSQWTKNRGPFSLIYCEMCLDRDDARSREIYLKTGMGKRYLKNRMRRFLSLTG